MGVVFDEAETARRLGETVEAHHQALDLTASVGSHILANCSTKWAI